LRSCWASLPARPDQPALEVASAFVRREDDSKITSTPYLTVDQGTACAALTTPEAEAKIMPDPEFTLAPGTNNWMQDFAWDPLKDEIDLHDSEHPHLKRSGNDQDQQARSC